VRYLNSDFVDLTSAVADWLVLVVENIDVHSDEGEFQAFFVDVAVAVVADGIASRFAPYK